jgi:adenylylsulfate kinase
VTGAVAWVTGLPASGKSTFARALAESIRGRGKPAVVLDGDDVRAALSPHPGYGADDRAAFYATLADLAALLAGQGLVVVVAATGHRRAFRDRARAKAGRFIEVFLDVPPEACARRDPKGLWAAARAGGLAALPGEGVVYEPPAKPDVVASGGRDAEALGRAVALLLEAG